MNGMMDMSQMGGMMKMPMDEGPIMIMGKWMPSMKTMIMSYTSYIEESNKIPMGGITINHKFKSGSMGYAKRYTRMSGDFGVTLDYSELFTDIKIKNKVSLIAKIKYDDETSKKIESIFGIGYENCCIAVRLTTSDKNLSKYLDNFENRLYEISSSKDSYLNDISQYLIKAGGKRFRPICTLLAGELGNGNNEKIIDAAVAVELIHLGSLYHDDVIDEAETRRSVQSANVKWNATLSILAGDYLLARSSELAAETLGLESVKLLASTYAELVEGQTKEVQYQYDLSLIHI